MREAWLRTGQPQTAAQVREFLLRKYIDGDPRITPAGGIDLPIAQIRRQNGGAVEQTNGQCHLRPGNYQLYSRLPRFRTPLPGFLKSIGLLIFWPRSSLFRVGIIAESQIVTGENHSLYLTGSQPSPHPQLKLDLEVVNPHGVTIDSLARLIHLQLLPFTTGDDRQIRKILLADHHAQIQSWHQSLTTIAGLAPDDIRHYQELASDLSALQTLHSCFFTIGSVETYTGPGVIGADQTIAAPRNAVESVSHGQVVIVTSREWVIIPPNYNLETDLFQRSLNVTDRRGHQTKPVWGTSAVGLPVGDPGYIGPLLFAVRLILNGKQDLAINKIDFLQPGQQLCASELVPNLLCPGRYTGQWQHENPPPGTRLMRWSY